MVVVPGANAVINPLVAPMLATPVLLLAQVPPAIALVRVVDVPVQSEVNPLIGADGFTVTGATAKQPPGSV
jgi:hypothetical protein